MHNLIIGTEISGASCAENLNKPQRLKFVGKVLSHFKNDLSGITIGSWRLAFRSKTVNMREAPIVAILNSLLGKWASIKVYDPKAYKAAKYYLGENFAYCNSSYDALEGTDCLPLLTELNEFRRLDFDRVKLIMKAPIIFDGRNQCNAQLLKQEGSL